MAYEQGDVPQSTPQSVPAHGFLNLLSLKTAAHDSKPAATPGEIFPDLPARSNGSNSRLGERFQTGMRSNFGGMPELKAENRTLDLNTPLYPGDKGPSVTTDDATLPVNKYERAVKEQVAGFASEAGFTPYTQAALNRDADRFPPVRNEKEGTTTYTIEQIGITDRNLQPGDANAEHFKRLVNITVPDTADSLKDCKFAYNDRQTISTKEFDALVDHSQKRQSDLSARSAPEGRLNGPKDMSFYTHGIRTGAEDADFMALALQLTNGHSVINVDWKSTAIRDENYGVKEAYDINRKGAAESYPKFEKALDQAIDHIGAARTDMIAFSHGAMFDTRYLQHRKETSAPMLDEVIFSHPDVKCKAMPQLDANQKAANSDRFFSSVSRRAFVIGSTSDLAMTGAAYNDCESAPKDAGVMERLSHHNRQMEINARLGNGGQISRTLVEGHGGTYVMETIPSDKKDFLNHFVNPDNISILMNDPDSVTKIANLVRPDVKRN